MLVTGGLGFIGSNFIRNFLSFNHSVHIINLDLCTYAASPINLDHNHQYTFIKGNIANRPLVDEILNRFNVDTILHFAAESHVDNSIKNPHHFIETNIVGTFTLLEAARHYWLLQNHLSEEECRFYHISTDEVYGSCDSLSARSFIEEDRYRPSSPYSASKASSNHLVNAFYHTYKLPVIISNSSNNYGPRQHTEKLIPTIIKNCLQGKSIPIYGDGSNIRDWLFVEDHCAAISTILHQGEIGQEFNVGAHHEVSNLEVAEAICSSMDTYYPKNYSHKDLITFVTDRPGHDWRYSLNCDKINKVLGWKPKVSFKDGLNKTISFYVELHYSKQQEVSNS